MKNPWPRHFGLCGLLVVTCLAVVSMPVAAQLQPKAMTGFPKGTFAGKVAKINRDGSRTNEVFLQLAGKGNQLKFGFEGQGSEAIGETTLSFASDGSCRQNRPRIDDAFNLKGTCLNNAVRLKSDYPNGLNRRELREFTYVWDGDVVHYASKAHSLITQPDGTETSTEERIIVGDLNRVAEN